MYSLNSDKHVAGLLPWKESSTSFLKISPVNEERYYLHAGFLDQQASNDHKKERDEADVNNPDFEGALQKWIKKYYMYLYA
jgi:hypothetical protein